MKVSIITVVYQGERFIESAIKSVLDQDYPDIEYIVIDGDSGDRTMELIESFGTKINTVVSEPDKGIYDAMNKGISLATGDIIGILNSDDFYRSDTIISKVVDRMISEKVDSVYGDLVYVDPEVTDKVRRYWKSGDFKSQRFLYGWMPPHPTFFIKRSVYLKYGFYNLGLRSAADYEFMLRVLFKHKVSCSHIPEVLTVMREGGISNASIRNRLKGNSEDARAWAQNDLKPLVVTRYLKPLRKLMQYISKPS